MPSFFARSAFVLALVLPGSLSAHDYGAGELSIAHPYARAVGATAMASAGYLEVRNDGTEPDRLVSVEADVPRVELHTIETGADGVVRMVPLSDGLTIAPGETVVLAPGGAHVMFMGIDGATFAAGETVPATLVFERAGRVEVSFAVEDLSQDAGDPDAMPSEPDHGSHGADHGSMDHEAHGMDHDEHGMDHGEHGMDHGEHGEMDHEAHLANPDHAAIHESHMGQADDDTATD